MAHSNVVTIATMTHATMAAITQVTIASMAQSVLYTSLYTSYWEVSVTQGHFLALTRNWETDIKAHQAQFSTLKVAAAPPTIQVIGDHTDKDR